MTIKQIFSLLVLTTTLTGCGMAVQQAATMATGAAPQKAPDTIAAAPAGTDDSVISSLKPDYLGPDSASESSKIWVKRAKMMAMGGSVENLNKNGFNQVAAACDGITGEKMAGKHSDWSYSADNALGQICQMFTSGKISSFLTGGNSGFRKDEQGRLIASHLYKGMFGPVRSKGKANNCMNVKMAKSSARSVEAFGNNPEVAVVAPALVKALENVEIGLKCEGVGGIFGF